MAEQKYGNIFEGSAQRPESVAAYQQRKAYLDQRTAYIVATRGMIPVEVALSWVSLAHPMNQARAWLSPAIGMEVADAYTQLFQGALDHPMSKEWPWVLTLEEDNIPPPAALMELFAAVYACVDCGKEISDKTWLCPDGHRGLDAISGLYWTKSDPPYPMAYGQPDLEIDGDYDFRPRSVQEAVEQKKTIEVNGIAMGFALWRKDMFRRISQPWFKTVSDIDGGDTQDLYFCRKAKREANARFGVACGIPVVHLDPATGRRF